MAAVPAFAQQTRDRNDTRDGDRVCFYKDIEFQGPSWCYRPGDELADLRDRGNEISSIRIFGRAHVIVYDLEEFMGASDEFDRDIPDLRLRVMEGRRDWNDRIDSFQVVAPGRGRGGFFGNIGRNDRDDRDDRDNRPSRDRISGGAGDWKALQQACELVVEAGTATLAKVPGIAVAGKTGTAQNPHGQDHALFAGYAPADDPRIAFAFVIENSGHGGSIAAPRAGFVLKKLFADTTAAKAAASLAVAVPDSAGGGGD